MSVQKVYTPDNYRKAGFLGSWKELFTSFKEYSGLTRELIKVSLVQQYKKSFFGIAWIFIAPVMSVVLWLLLKASGVFEPGDTGIPYAPYLLLSTTIWGFFMGFYKSLSMTITGRGGVLLQTNFPHTIIIAEKVAVVTINFIITFALILGVLILFKIKFTWASLLFPFFILPLVLIGSALGLMFAILKVVAVDLTVFFDKAVVLLMYISPVIVSRKVNSELLQTLMHYNPLTYLIDFPRQVLVTGEFVEPEKFLICSAGALVAFLLMVRFYFRSTPIIMEKITV